MIEISSAGTRSFVQSATSKGGRESRGRPLGTSPTILTPCWSSPRPQTARMDTTRATAGPIFASVPAVRSESPERTSRGLRRLRDQKRNASAATPMAAVAGLMLPRSFSSEWTISTNVSPSARMPRTGPSWPAAIWRPEAVMNPETTGWLRKFARNPSRSSPMATSIRPETSASAMAAPRYSGVPWAASGRWPPRSSGSPPPRARPPACARCRRPRRAASGAIDAKSPTCTGSPASSA